MQLTDKPPKCDECGRRHWYSEPCLGKPVTDDSPPVDYEKPVTYPVNPNDLSDRELIREALARIESLEDRVEKLESRKKYQREYMRERRAKENDE